jgi:hypothetical protein
MPLLPLLAHWKLLEHDRGISPYRTVVLFPTMGYRGTRYHSSIEKVLEALFLLSIQKKESRAAWKRWSNLGRIRNKK